MAPFVPKIKEQIRKAAEDDEGAEGTSYKEEGASSSSF